MKGSTAFDHIVNYLAYLAGALVIFDMLSVAAEVMSRKFLATSFIWVIPYSEYSLLYITFLGTTYVLKNDGHPSLDLVANKLTPRNQALLNAITSIIGAIMCLFVACFTAATTFDLFQRGVYDITLLETPKWPLVLVMPIGSLLLFIQFLRRAYGYLQRRRVTPVGPVITPPKAL